MSEAAKVIIEFFILFFFHLIGVSEPLSCSESLVRNFVKLFYLFSFPFLLFLFYFRLHFFVGNFVKKFEQRSLFCRKYTYWLSPFI